MSNDRMAIQEGRDQADSVGLGSDRTDEFWERIRMSAEWTLQNRECSPELCELVTEIVTEGADPDRYERWWDLDEHVMDLFRFTPGVLEMIAEIETDGDMEEQSGVPHE